MAQLIVRTAEDNEQKEEITLTPEHAALLIRLMAQATQEVDSYIERIKDCPTLFDTERN